MNHLSRKPGIHPIFFQVFQRYPGSAASFSDPIATIIAFNYTEGRATRESTKNSYHFLQKRIMVAHLQGELGLSVIAIAVAPCFLTNCMAFVVLLEYLGKLIPITTSPPLHSESVRTFH